MIISRTFSGNVWILELMLKYFNEELEAKEICVSFKSTSSENDEVKDKIRAGYTSSFLHSESYESKSHKRVYCSENHRPSQCKKVINRQKCVLQNIFAENAIENTTFLFVTKEKIEVAMPAK